MPRFATMLVAASLLAAPASAEVTLSFYSGIQEAFDSHVRGDVDGNDFDFLADWEGRSFEMPPHWGIRATWWRTENIGYGLDFNHTKVYASDDTLDEFGFDDLELTDGLNILTANVFYRWPGQWADGRLTPYVGAGLGISIPHVDVQRGDSDTFGYQFTGPAAMVAAGASWAFNDRWAVFGEYKSTFSANSADLDGGGELETNITTYALNLGLSYSF